MKRKNLYYLFFILIAIAFASCNTNELPEESATAKSYIINYGDYAGAKGNITAVDFEKDSVVNNYFKVKNGVDIISNLQHACLFDGKIYLMGNNADQVFSVDAETFMQTENGITENVVKPRFAVGNGSYLYVSCWGGDIWSDESLSYIAKINISTRKVEKKIALPGGPEGMALANNKLYAALNYKDSVAVIQLNNDAVSYIKTPAVTSFFVKDKSQNLYVSLVSTYSDFSDKTGLGYINTSTDKLDATYLLDGVSTSYVNILAPNADFSKLYVMTSAYDANWNLSGAVAVFNVASKSFETKKLVEGISGLNGIAVQEDNVICFVAETVTGNGLAKIYSSTGMLKKEIQTGIAPFMLLTGN